MRKKMLFMLLALATTAGALTPRADAATGYFCPSCTTYPDGSSCCVSCWCNGQGIPVWCTDNYCP
jgi:hypothetical protein